jgi:hypothetical protein
MIRLLICVLVLSLQAEQIVQVPAEHDSHSVIVRWNAPATGTYDGFHIYRADGCCNNFVYLQSVPVTRNLTVDYKVIGGATYKYKVRSTMKGVESIDSNVSIITVPLN